MRTDSHARPRVSTSTVMTEFNTQLTGGSGKSDTRNQILEAVQVRWSVRDANRSAFASELSRSHRVSALYTLCQPHTALPLSRRSYHPEEHEYPFAVLAAISTPASQSLLSGPARHSRPIVGVNDAVHGVSWGVSRGRRR